jgi:flagellar hook-associated protein 3 FlgL
MIDRVSSYAPSIAMDSQIQQMQSELTQITREISSGQATNPSGGAALYVLQYQAGQQAAYQSAITEAGNRIDTMQTALSSIASAAQAVTADALNSNAQSGSGLSILGTQAQDTLDQVIELLNTQYDGQSVFAGDNGSVTPMVASSAPGGPLATMNAVLSAAVTAKGGPLSAADIGQLINGANGIASVFNGTNASPGQNYDGAFYAAAGNGSPIQVAVGASQTVAYNVTADQQPFRDLLQGISMLTLLNAPAAELDDSAKSAIATEAANLLANAQSELTSTQATLGIAQSQLHQAADVQQSAALNTQQQILTFTQANTYADSSELDALQTQLQASYDVTAEITKLTLANYPQIFTA